MRFVDSFIECDANDCNDPSNKIAPETPHPIDKYITGDLYVDYALKTPGGTTRIAAGVNNVNDATPPVVYNGLGLNADETAYDFMGRYFYVRLSQLF